MTGEGKELCYVFFIYYTHVKYETLNNLHVSSFLSIFYKNSKIIIKITCVLGSYVAVVFIFLVFVPWLNSVNAKHPIICKND